jgi:peroxiredoxin
MLDSDFSLAATSIASTEETNYSVRSQIGLSSVEDGGFTMASIRVSLLVASIVVFGLASEARTESVTISKAVQDACA